MSSVAMRSAVSTRTPRNLIASRRVAHIAAPVEAPRVSARRSIIVASDADRAADKARDVVEQGKRNVQEGFENVKERAQEGVDNLKERAQNPTSTGGADTQHQGSDGRFDARQEMSSQDKAAADDMGAGIPANTNYSVDDAFGKAREIKERNTGNSEPYAKEAAQNIGDKAFGAADRAADRVGGAPERTEGVVGGVADAFANKFQEAKDAVGGQVNRDGQWLKDTVAGDGTENFGLTAIENVKKQAREGRQLSDNERQQGEEQQS